MMIPFYADFFHKQSAALIVVAGVQEKSGAGSNTCLILLKYACHQF